jgi:hypothetical protein
MGKVQKPLDSTWCTNVSLCLSLINDASSVDTISVLPTVSRTEVWRHVRNKLHKISCLFGYDAVWFGR